MGQAASWACPDCGQQNLISAALCAFCGRSRLSVLDPALPMPYRPPVSRTEAFLPTLLWGALSFGGLLLVMNAAWREALGLSPTFALLELLLAFAAFGSAALSLVWERWFYQVEFSAPTTVLAGQVFPVTITLVPYLSLKNVSISVVFIDRYYERDRNGKRILRSRLEGGMSLAERAALRPRRENVFQGEFIGPAPLERHSDAGAELLASLLSPLGFLLPAAAHYAANLKQHGGYYVRATVRVGFFRRSFERRVISVLIGSRLYVG